MYAIRSYYVVEGTAREGSLEVEALMRASREKIEKILSLKNMPVEILMVTENIDNPGILADLVRITSYNVCYTKLLRLPSAMTAAAKPKVA